MMYLALTYDHRLLDGREAVVFLVKVSFLPANIGTIIPFLTFIGVLKVKEYIEDPRKMLLG